MASGRPILPRGEAERSSREAEPSGPLASASERPPLPKGGP
jgi:hypothetical protein